MKSPPKTPKKKATASTPAATVIPTVTSPTYIPKGWETRRVFLVYQRPSARSSSSSSGSGSGSGSVGGDGGEKKVPNVKGKNQGVWTEGYVASSNPQELWVFDNDNVPSDLFPKPSSSPPPLKQDKQGQGQEEESDVTTPPSSPNVSKATKKVASPANTTPKKSPRTPPRTPNNKKVGSSTSLTSSSCSSRPHGHQHIHGVWGYKPGSEDPENEPNDVWFFPPEYGLDEVVNGSSGRKTEEKDDNSIKHSSSSSSSKKKKPLPIYFTPRGYWTYPLVKRNTSEIAPDATGWLGLASSPKIEKLDVGGTWRMLYKQGGLEDDDDEVKGPGMKSSKSKSPKKSPRSPKKKSKTIQIVVETSEGKRIPVKVLPTDTIGSVKDKVQDGEGIPKSEQRLLPPKRGEGDNSLPLVDTQTINDCGLTNGGVLRLQPMQVFVKNNFDPSSSSTSSLSSENQLFVVDVPKNDQETISQLKKYIEKKSSIKPDDQLLSLNKQPINDDAFTLRHYGIKHGDTLDLDPWHVIVHEPRTGKEFSFKIHPSDTISMIQSKIEKQENIPKRYVDLSYDGRKLDQPQKTVKACGIRPGSRLDLQPIELLVERPRGRDSFPLVDLSPSVTLQSIKQQIKEKTGIPVDEQQLLVNGKPIDQNGDKDDSTLKDLEIHNGDVLRLNGMELDVEHWKGKKTYDVKDLDPIVDTIHDLKRRLNKQYGIKDPRLTYQDLPLNEDTMTLADYSIPNRATLKMEPSEIEVVATDGQTMKMPVDIHKNTLDDVRNRIHKEFGIPINEQRLFLNDIFLDDNETPSKTLAEYDLDHGSTLYLKETIVLVKNRATGVTFSLTVNLSNTISEVKDAIEGHPDGLPKPFQNLSANEKTLGSEHNRRTLEDCSIKHSDILVLDDIEVNIQLPDDKIIKAKVPPNATIGDAKKKINDDKGISSGDKQLKTKNGKMLDDETKTLLEYDIPHKSTLLMTPMEIHVGVNTLDGKKVYIPISPSDKIHDVKNKVENETGIPVADQQLFLKGQNLKDPRTVSEYCIKDGTTLDLGGMQINVKHFNGNTLLLPVVLDNTLLDVKKMIETSEKTPSDEQNIIFGGGLLCHDSRTLGEYKIKNGSTLKVEPMKIIVQTSSGKFPLIVEPTLTILGLKDKIQKKSGIEAKDQTLLHRGHELDDLRSTIKESPLEHRDSVIVEVKNQPTYTVTLGEYQSAFDFVPSPRKKREGVRAKRTYKTVGDFRSTIADNEKGNFEHKTTDADD